MLLCNDSFLQTLRHTLPPAKQNGQFYRQRQKGVLLSIITVLVVDIFSLSSAVIQYVVVVFIVSFLLLFISAQIQRLLFFSALLLPQLLLLLLPSKKLNWGKQSYSFSYWHSVRAFCTAQR